MVTTAAERGGFEPFFEGLVYPKSLFLQQALTEWRNAEGCTKGVKSIRRITAEFGYAGIALFSLVETISLLFIGIIFKLVGLANQRSAKAAEQCFTMKSIILLNAQISFRCLYHNLADEKILTYYEVLKAKGLATTVAVT